VVTNPNIARKLLNAPNKVHFGIDVKIMRSKDNLGSIVGI
jgi:hypothetical protein